jgi:isoleucyl-tRNA synthetase
MQNAIETGRLIRDNNKISMKYPLSRVILVDADKEALEDYRLLSKYIKEELNCLEIELKSNEDDYIVYKAEGENRAMGQAFGKKFDKAAKAKIMALSSEEIRTYLATGKVDVAGLPVVKGMLTVSKAFNTDYQNNKSFACASSMKSSVMLDIVQTDDLKDIGLAREVTNRIQRLRKTSGISIDDQIEIFYKYDNENMAVAKVAQKYADKVIAQTRMPFLSFNHKQGDQVFIGETEFINPDDEKDQIKIYIYLSAPKFTEKVAEEYAKHGASFVHDLQNFVLQHDRKVLANMVRDKGVIEVVLNGVKVSLEHKKHFYLDARDMLTAKN